MCERNIMDFSKTPRVRALLLAVAVFSLYLYNNNMLRLPTWFTNDAVDPYRILNVTRDASKAEIRSAFKKLALTIHPDKNKQCDTTELFHILNNAYDVLSDTRERDEYGLANPDAGTRTEEYTWDTGFCLRPYHIITTFYIRPVWDSLDLRAAFTTMTEIVQQYGWFMVLGCLVLLYIRSKLKPAYKQMKRKAEESRDKKIDPDVAQSRLESMERARQRLQEEHDARAALYMEKQLIKEEEKRQTKIEEWENLQQGKAYRSKVKPRDETSEPAKGFKPKPKLRDTDYSPLMGGGGGGGAFRPSRRAGGGGGG